MKRKMTRLRSATLVMESERSKQILCLVRMLEYVRLESMSMEAPRLTAAVEATLGELRFAAQ